MDNSAAGLTMGDESTRRLSDLMSGATGRRGFLSRAAILGTALPALGTALAACDDSTGARKSPAADSLHAASGEQAVPRHTRSNDDAAPVGAGAVGYQRYDPVLPPLPRGGFRASSRSRTCLTSASGWKGFCWNGTPGSSRPRRTTSSPVNPDM